MAKLSKRARLIREKVDVLKDYDIAEAITLLKELATAKFRESVDVAVNLGIDARKSDQNVRGAAVPRGRRADSSSEPRRRQRRVQQRAEQPAMPRLEPASSE